MNTVIIAGNIGKDAELRHTQSGDAVASFSVADSQGRDKPTIWWRCNLWGKRAEVLSQYLTKGSRVTVTGSAVERKWTDKDGQERVTLEIRVNDIALQGGGEQSEAPRQARQSAPARSEQGGGFDDSEEIPFDNPYRGFRSLVV